MSRSNLRTILVLVVTTILILGGVLLVKAPWKSDSTVTPIDVVVDPANVLKVGNPAPDFTAVTTDGNTITLTELRGEPVWLVFGATWCTNCRAEAPDVQAVAEAFQGRATVVSIYTGETTSTVQDYAKRLGLTNPQIADSTNALAFTYAVMGIPAHFFIDSDGVIQKIMVGTLPVQTPTEILTSLLPKD